MDVAEVKQAMHSILLEKLHGVKYSSDASATACREIAESIKTRLLGTPAGLSLSNSRPTVARPVAIDSTRYKYIVEVQILEKRGGGFRYARFYFRFLFYEFAFSGEGVRVFFLAYVWAVFWLRLTVLPC